MEILPVNISFIGLLLSNLLTAVAFFLPPSFIWPASVHPRLFEDARAPELGSDAAAKAGAADTPGGPQPILPKTPSPSWSSPLTSPFTTSSSSSSHFNP